MVKYYEEPKILFNSPEKHWKKQDNSLVDLALGLDYDIIAGVEPDGKFATDHFNTKASEKRLTNGKKAENIHFEDPNINRFTIGGNRSVIFDLGATSAVEYVNLHILYEHSVLCGMPNIVKIFLSENGRDWQNVNTLVPDTPEEDNIMVHFKLDFDKPYLARYVKVFFKLTLHSYFEEIEIFGRKSEENASHITPEKSAVSDFYGYPKPENFHNIHNMALLYHCLANNGGLLSKEDLLPIFAYYKDGKIADTFFDSALMLPNTKFLFIENTHTIESWKYYIDNCFAENYNVNALEDAVSEISATLGKDIKVKVFLTILPPHKNITYFGNGLDMSKPEDRKKAVNWLINTQKERFESGNYKHLELCGFYWFNESLSSSDKEQYELLKSIRETLNDYNLSMLWIPYYLAGGYDEWREMGFDYACMQPNYVFNTGITKDRLYINADAAEKLGMGVEIELHWTHSKDYLTKYLQYLEVGAETGYMLCPKIYYEGDGIGKALKSENENYRSIYDATYLFAKEKLTPEKALEFIDNLK